MPARIQGRSSHVGPGEGRGLSPSTSPRATRGEGDFLHPIPSTATPHPEPARYCLPPEEITGSRPPQTPSFAPNLPAGPPRRDGVCCSGMEQRRRPRCSRPGSPLPSSGLRRAGRSEKAFYVRARVCVHHMMAVHLYPRTKAAHCLRPKQASRQREGGGCREN